MIVDTDNEFHERDLTDPTWAETTFLPISIPEAGLFANAYVLARPNVGAALSSVLMAKGFYTQPYEIDYTDTQVHLPCPPSFSKYSLINGLTVESDSPRNYHMTYESKLGSAGFDLTFRGLHDPFDPHDPNQNPLLEHDKAAGADKTRGDEWENGHFEVKGHVTGQLHLRGTTYDVDYYEGMDHSWGPRPELGRRSVSWISINFGEDLALHLAVPMRIVKGEVIYDPLRFGFVVDNGEVHGLVQGNVQAKRHEMMPYSNHITATDVRGKTYEFFGTAIAGHPYYSFNPCHTCFQSLFRYTYGTRVGYGEMGDIFGLEYLAEHLTGDGQYR